MIILQESKFELLLEMGVLAFVDGYYREAVASLAASIERLYEFYIFAVAQNRGINEVEISSTWKNVKNQSERQIGAFLFLYLLENGKRPEVLSNRFTEFRNNVIHKGYFPTKDEVIEYGEVIVQIMDNIMNLLVTNYKDSVLKLQTEVQREFIKRCEGKHYSIMTVPTSICLSRPSLIGTRSFIDMVNERIGF